MSDRRGTNKTYEKSVVAFLDILGFKELVTKGKLSVVLGAMEIIKKRIKLIDSFRDSPLKSSQFSDSLIISAPDNDDGVIHLVHFTSLLASQLCLSGIWTRGALTMGQMHHRGDVAFGPALIDAVEMERELAIYPRILTTCSLAERFVRAKNELVP